MSAQRGAPGARASPDARTQRSFEFLENEGRIRRLRHAPRRPALGAPSPGIGSDDEDDAADPAHGGPLPAQRRDTRNRPRAAPADRHEKTAAPGQGTSGVRLVVPPHFAAASRPPLPARRDETRCGGSVTGADSPCRAPAAAYWGACGAPVRSGARRSCSPAFLVPLRSCRGSLARFRRVLVLVIASVFGCGRTLAAMGRFVNGSMRRSYDSKSAWRSKATVGSDSARTIPWR